MGGSRRRLKRNAPKVRVGVVKRKKSTKAAVPQQMIVAADELGARLGGRCAPAPCGHSCAAAQQLR